MTNHTKSIRVATYDNNSREVYFYSDNGTTGVLNLATDGTVAYRLL